MLSDVQKRKINKVLEDYSELKSIGLSVPKRAAEIFLSVCPDEETNKVRSLEELSDLTWSEALNKRYAFHLSGLSKIEISCHTEVLPKEIEGINMPSSEFILFAASLFDQQGIYEWDCFEDPLKRFQREWKATWTYEFQPKQEISSESILFFKERLGGVWVIGLWFSNLRIEDGAVQFPGASERRPPDEEDFITVEEFASRYPRRVGNNP